MQDKLRTAAHASLFLLLIIVSLYGLTRISLSTQRVPVSRSPSNLLAKSGIPLERNDSGEYAQNPRYFWGQLTEANNTPSASTSNLAAKSGIPSSSPSAEQSDYQEATQPPLWYYPRIPVRSALAQVPRIARERQLAESEVAALVRRYTEGRLLGLAGDPRVNVRDLNRALDRLTDG